MSCVLLLGLIWGLSQSSLAQYCVEQPNRKESFIGESIAIPFSFTYLESENLNAVSLAVKAAQIGYCGSDDDIIYNSSISITSPQYTIYNSSINIKSPQYTGRLAVLYNLEARTSLLTIKDLRSQDQQIYCCRLRIHFSNGSSIPWQHPVGTRVVVRGEDEMILEEENLILALTGDIVTIIARFTFKNRTMIANLTKCDVFRSTNDNDFGNQLYPITCTQRTNENIVFFKINSTDDSHNGFYYYEVSAGGYSYTGHKNLRSQLLVLKPSSGSKINQPTEVVFRGPVIINCSFSIQDIISPYAIGDRSTLWTQVYWMVGEPREHFVYHPNGDYIHPEYRGKTKLIGRSDLLLEDFHGPDNTTLYCRVEVRICLMRPPPNCMKSILEEGPGTVLRVQEKVGPSSKPLDFWIQAVIVALFVGFAVLLFSVLFIKWLKARKDYENIEELQKEAKETNEKLLYVMVNHSEPRTTKPQEVSEEPEVVYSSVKKQRKSSKK
ncbi:uncharacterized protein [Phyllobates terribilis]|uniref:uncharacterized protein isoform X2 n=1 Tax=Phyllobates terribilis TaxID=111132 RepID=UPI003CCAB400